MTQASRNVKAVCFAYEHLIDRLGGSLAELLEDHVPHEVSADVGRDLRTQAARSAEHSLMPKIVRAMDESGEWDEADFLEDFEWAYQRGTDAVRKMLTSVAERL